MPIIIYNRDNISNDIGGENLIIVIAAVILVIVLFVRFGLPALQKNNGNNITVNVPDKIQVSSNK